MSGLRNAFNEIRRYPSAVAGLVIIALLFVFAAYALIKIPPAEAIRLWKGEGQIWRQVPRNAKPAWLNYFYKEKQPLTTKLSSIDNPELKTAVDLGSGIATQDFVFEFDYQYDGFPSEISLFFISKFTSARPYATVKWVTPDGREIKLADLTVSSADNAYVISQDSNVTRALGGVRPDRGLFADPNDPSKVLKGTYQLVVEGLVFEENSTMEAELVVYGKLHGLAGTDHRRRDIMVALMWVHLLPCPLVC